MKIRIVPVSRLMWNLLYLLGRPPWDTGVTPPELVEAVEGRQVPPGRALDIGCGKGTNAIYLARHGFQAQGVDVAWLAVRRARRKRSGHVRPYRSWPEASWTWEQRKAPL